MLASGKDAQARALILHKLRGTQKPAGRRIWIRPCRNRQQCDRRSRGRLQSRRPRPAVQGSSYKETQARCALCECGHRGADTNSSREPGKHYEKTFDINARGVFFTVQKALSLMKEGGSIILTGSRGLAERYPGLCNLRRNQGSSTLVRAHMDGGVRRQRNPHERDQSGPPSRRLFLKVNLARTRMR
jgi:hypothetical protein